MTPEEEKLMAESITLHNAARDAGARKLYDARVGNKVAENNDAHIQALDNALAAPIDAQLKQLESAPAPVAAAPAAPTPPAPSTGASFTQTGAAAAPPAPVTHPSGGAPVAAPTHTSTPAHGTGATFTTTGSVHAPVASPTHEPTSTHTGATPASHPSTGATLTINHTPSATFTQTGATDQPPASHPVATGFGTGGDVHPIQNPLSGGSAPGHASAPTASPPAPAGHSTPEGTSTHTSTAPAPHSDGGASVGTAAAAYTVVKGDTLSGIAAAHHMSLAEVESLNPQIKNPNLILPGETVHLSANMPTSSSYGSIVSGTHSSGGEGAAVLDTQSTSKKGLLGGIFGRFGRGGSTEGTLPPTDVAKTAVADPTKSDHRTG